MGASLAQVKFSNPVLRRSEARVALFGLGKILSSPPYRLWYLEKLERVGNSEILATRPEGRELKHFKKGESDP